MTDSTRNIALRRVLFVCSFSGHGGAERSLIPVLTELLRDNVKPTVFFVRNLDYDSFVTLIPDRARILGSRRPTGRVLSHFSRILTLISLAREVSQTDIVVAASELTPTYIAWILAFFFKKPLLAEVHINFEQHILNTDAKLHSWFSHWVYPKLKHIRVVSEHLGDSLATSYGVDRSRIHFVPVGIDVEQVKLEAEVAIPQRFVSWFKKTVILVVARLEAQKRVDLAISCLQLVREKYKIDAVLVVLGEGSQRPALEQLVRERGLGDDVYLAGHVDNPFFAMKYASALLLPSDFEGWGRVIAEAMIVGCPVVSTNCPYGPSEVLLNGDLGILVPVDDAASMADAVARLITNDAVAQSFTSKAKLNIEMSNWENSARQYVEVLREVMRD